LTVHGVSGVSKIEIHTAELLVPQSCHFEVENRNVKLKNHKTPDSEQIPADVIKVGGEILHSDIHEPIKYIRNEEELPDQ
jgi:hypothetical protein